ncbi:isochorismatase family protein [Halobellus sp. GM3]|uniref:isochorismatase family protein n=1 Tax=Halobellus sp. GM3 TaxID=3458410 RepID=UPI00403E1462
MAYTDLDTLVDLDSTALVVVDVQRAFASPDSPLTDAGLDVSAAVEAVPRVRELLALARDADLPIAFTRSYRRADGRDAPEAVYDVLPKINRSGDPICRAGSDDVQFVEGVEPTDDDHEYEVHKQRYDAFHGTPLEYYLRAEGVDTLLVCGFTTNVCVEGTARGAHERGFNVVLVEDCCASFSAEQHEAGVRNVEMLLGTTAPLAAVGSALFGKPADELSVAGD